MKKKSLNIGSLKISKEKISNLHTIKGGAGDTEAFNTYYTDASCPGGDCGPGPTGLYTGATCDINCDKPFSEGCGTLMCPTTPGVSCRIEISPTVWLC